MSDFGSECVAMDCPFCRGGFDITQEGYLEFQVWKEKCPYARNCSYVDNLDSYFESLGFDEQS